mgnify:CR=1 FL=1
MIKYIFKRLALTIISIFILLTLLFFLLQLVPGFPIEKGLNESIEDFNERLRGLGLLDDPFTQYANFWRGLFERGEFGVRYTSSISVIDTFIEPIKFTLLIALPAFVISSLVGITLGTISAYNRGKWQDTTINIFAVVFAAIPSFVMALFLIQLAGSIGLPVSFVAPGSDGFTIEKMIQSIIIPVLAMVLASTSITVYFTRNELVEVFKQEYIKTALAKGMPVIQVLFKHAARNAMIPVLFSLLPNLIVVISGSFIIESFFNVPGSALIIIESIQTKEVFVVMFAAVFFSGIYFILQIIFDALSTVIDPRIKLTESSNKSLFKMGIAKLSRIKDDGSTYVNNLNSSIKNNLFDKKLIQEKLNIKNFELIPINANKCHVTFDELKVNKGINFSYFKLENPSKRSFIDSGGKPSTRWKDVFKRFFKENGAVFFVIIFGLIILTSIISPLIYQVGPDNVVIPGIKNLGTFLPPRIPFLGLSGILTRTMTQIEIDTWISAGVNIIEQEVIAPNQFLVTFNPFEADALKNYYPILGTGPLGEDWNNKLWYATAQSLLFAIIVSAASTIIGAIYGAIAGYNAGKTVDLLMMRLVEILSGVPTIVWLLVFSLVFSGGTLSLITIGISLVVISWIWPAITARVYIMKYKDADYIEASRTLGASHSRLIFSHLIPNISGKLMVRFVNQIPRMIFFETSLIFLGLTSATSTNLGTMIDVARTTNLFYLLVGPAFVIILITLSSQIIANAFNDSLDPRVSGGK